MKDSFKAKGLKEAREALDIMRLPADNTYSYNRYLDYVRYKASEMYSLKVAPEEWARENEKTELAKNAIAEGFDDNMIAKLTRLSVEQVEVIRRNFAP